MSVFKKIRNKSTGESLTVEVIGMDTAGDYLTVRIKGSYGSNGFVLSEWVIEEPPFELPQKSWAVVTATKKMSGVTWAFMRGEDEDEWVREDGGELLYEGHELLGDGEYMNFKVIFEGVDVE